jgi:hypothetical protein
MATSRSQRQVIEDLTRTYGPEVAAAFDEAMLDLRSRAEVRRVIEALRAGNIDAALDALHIDEAVFERLTEALAQAQAEGGRSAVEFMPRRAPDGTALIIRHRPGDPVAAARLREHSARLVTGITDDIRAVVRGNLADAMEAGRGPGSAAIEIVGRVNRATGRREGGVLGLTDPQAQAVRRAREELASTDPTALRSYLTRGRRDRRFDRTVERAIRDGTPIPTETRRRMIRAYESRLLELRGQVIGRTEAMTALQRGSFDAYRQAIEAGKVDAAAVTKIWRSARDLRVRHSHIVLDGESAGFLTPFTSPSGAQMMHPMDTSLGAGAEEIINCRCWCEYRVDAFYNFRRAA